MADADTMGWGIVLVLLFYFIPTVVARNAYHRHLTAIFVLNLFLGWTFIGWVIALVWANMDQAPDDHILWREVRRGG